MLRVVPGDVWVRSAVALLGLGAGFGLVRSCTSPPTPSELSQHCFGAGADAAPRDEPLALPRLRGGGLALSAEDVGRVHLRMREVRPEEWGVGHSLHWLRLRGPAAVRPAAPDAAETMVDLLTDEAASRRVFGNSAVIRTRYGARFPMTRGGFAPDDRSLEAHRDQCLATLAQAGVPLSRPIRFTDGHGTVRDVLRDSLANFHVSQDELEWTAVAYALYLPPAANWVNRYGEPGSFDATVHALLDKDPAKTPCAGTHTLTAVTTIARVDEETPILSREVRALAAARVRAAVAAAVRNQNPDGSWPPDWLRQDGPVGGGWGRPPSRLDQLLTTGHVAEWLLDVPAGVDVPHDSLVRAGRWLAAAFRDPPAPYVAAHYCPYSHAAGVIERLTAGGAGDGGSPGVRSRPERGDGP